MYVYGTCLFYVCCSNYVGVCGNVCCVAAIVKKDVMDVVFSVCIVRRGAVGARVWGV